VIEGCEASLRRLRTDHIDLYQLHEWDGQTPIEETLGALEQLLESGKVRYVGCSNYTAWQMVKALGIADARGLPRFVSTQVYYSLQERSIEHEILPACLDLGVGLLVWSPLAGGLLSGKYRRGVSAPDGSRHLTDWDEPPVYDEGRLYDTIDVLVEIADGHGVSAAQVALAWLLRRPGVASLVIGARTDEQLADNLKAAHLELGDEELRRLDEVSRPPLPYPLWHQVKTAADRLGPADVALLGPYLRGGPR
jgi:aryl-alcohol dehydrogenase-like predicted oxidoreductase